MLAGFALAASSFSAAADPSAPITCSLSPSNSVLTITVNHWGNSNFYRLRRSGPKFVLTARIARHSAHTIACTGDVPTIHNVARILVNQTQRLGETSASPFDVDMSRGRFAPGPTQEPTGSSEIEVALDLPRSQLEVQAPPGPNRLSFGVNRHSLGLNVNRDRDADIRFDRPFSLDVSDGGGNDLIDANTGDQRVKPRRPLLFLFGNAGEDKLIGGGIGDQLYGGGGKDLLRGRHGAGVLNGGSRADRIFAVSSGTLIQGHTGNDQIHARNGRRDWIECGPGRDRATTDRHEEHLSGCERS